MIPEVAKLITLPQLAGLLGVHRSTVWRWLMSMRRKDRLASRRDWLIHMGKGHRGLRVNLHRLRRAHPELFNEPSPLATENRLDRIEDDVESLQVRQKAHGSLLREHERKLRIRVG